MRYNYCTNEQLDKQDRAENTDAATDGGHTIMMIRKGKSTKVIIFLSAGILIMLIVGVMTGWGLASLNNVEELDSIGQPDNALPSVVLDRKGRVITEFFADEKRELITIDELPRHLIYALITREDQSFFRHRGFSIQGMARAAWNVVTNRYFSGGSTLTQQLAGHLYADRREITVSRKLRELWWALQLEKHLTKEQILERYLNAMFFGHGNYGVESAARYYFGHSARELTVAESVMLVIQLANPSLYSPIRRPNEARTMQRIILDQMVEQSYISQEEVDLSFEEYWGSYDYTRSNTSTAFFDREDRAPYFSEYVRYRLENEYLLGSLDINRDGFIIHTTLDIEFQEAAERYMTPGLERANQIYQKTSQRQASGGSDYAAIVDMLALAFEIPGIRSGGATLRRDVLKYYREDLNPIIDVVSLLFAADSEEPLRRIAQQSYSYSEEESKRTTVEGALVTLENNTGHILAMIGGSKFESRNQFNRAADGRVEPGSAFKPLYYSAAIENRVATPATLIYDAPVVFWNDDGTPYKPNNYKGVWEGPVLVRTALARSMNVPSLRILERVGFDSALDTSRRLLGIPADEMIERNLVRRYPVGLGIVEVAPIEMARAYATIVNQGRTIEPIAIRYIEDRDGRIILEPEKDIQAELRRRNRQVLSPQTAYVMTDMLQSTVQYGTLAYAASLVDGFDMPTAGKTGTTQNWADAWTVGFSPYVTTAIWVGFDRGGTNSLGTNQTGAVTAGPVWARYMKEIHSKLPHRNFTAPTEGIRRLNVSARTGLLPLEDYRGRVITEIFLSGTEPTTFDTQQQFERERETLLIDRLRDSLLGGNSDPGFSDLGPIDLGPEASSDALEIAPDPGLTQEDAVLDIDLQIDQETEGAVIVGPEQQSTLELPDPDPQPAADVDAILN